MATARGGYTATRLQNGTVLVAGGTEITPFGSEALASAEVYDPNNGTWSGTGSMIEARSGHSATLLMPSGKVLVAGGRSGRLGSGEYLASAELYDPSQGTWSSVGSMAEARSGPTATLLLDGTVLVTGGSFGSLSGDALASAELYDPGAASWTAAAPMIEARSGHTATLLPGGKVLVAGDGSGIQHASAEVYDPGNASWSATRNMGGIRFAHTATLLPGGRVLVAGGGGASGDPLASAEVYDSATGSWTSTGSLNERRYDLTATLLLDGTVLVAGGFGSAGALASAEVFHPDSATWTTAAAMIEPRHGPTATLLADGRVLVAGGTDATGTHYQATAEVYDPNTGS